MICTGTVCTLKIGMFQVYHINIKCVNNKRDRHQQIK